MNFVIGPLRCSCTQVSVFTGEEHLEKVVIIELIIVVQIEVSDKLSEIKRIELPISVFAHELAQRISVESTNTMTVKSPESRIWFKISHCTENLPKLFDSDLLFRCEY